MRCSEAYIALQDGMHLNGENLNRSQPGILWALVLLMLMSQPGGAQEKAEALAFQDDDMVVWVGNTFVERAQSYGYLETLLDLEAGRQGKTSVKFRNLGWSGDNVWCAARSYFGPPQEGFDRLQKGLGELKATLIFSNYGGAEAMEQRLEGESEEQALQRFVEGYTRLLKMMIPAAGDGLREIVLLSPTPLENMGEPLPDQTQNNQRIARYRDAIAKLAKVDMGAKVKLRFVDLFAAMGGDDFSGKVTEAPLTNNGIHFTEAGYRVVAEKLVVALGMEKLSLIENEADLDKMRQAVIEKNRLFFHRWRPSNETYLFLFRKHEQGQNAKEIPMFDPLVKTKEKQVSYLREQVLSNLSKR
ncbi:MAG: GDSL-type esterase/lipase family protein [Verrucomicrobiota bacterium]